MMATTTRSSSRVKPAVRGRAWIVNRGSWMVRIVIRLFMFAPFSETTAADSPPRRSRNALLHAFQRRERNRLPVRAADHAVVDDGGRLAERRVVVGELEIAALARVERRAAVIELLHPVHLCAHEAVGPRCPA